MSSSSPISLILATPLYLWDLYVEYLWNYKPGTWVYRIASTSWILAFLVLAPFVILTLLDVASYVIARTLGVVESTKASTGEMPVEVQHKPRDGGNGSINGTSPTVVDGDANVPSIHVVDPTPPMSASNVLGEDDATSYLENSVVSEGNLQLAGIDAFSPAPSQPPSPTISRTSLNGSRFTLRPLTELSGKTGRESSDDSENSGDRSSEEVSGVQMRRRVRNERDDRDG